MLTGLLLLYKNINTLFEVVACFGEYFQVGGRPQAMKGGGGGPA